MTHTADATALKTQNEAHGFYGTIGYSVADAEDAWAAAFAALRAASEVSDDAIRWFLDSRSGRHFADSVAESLQRRRTLKDALARAITQWMTWTISRTTSRHTGILQGLPYLTGFLCDAEIRIDLEN